MRQTRLFLAFSAAVFIPSLLPSLVPTLLIFQCAAVLMLLVFWIYLRLKNQVKKQQIGRLLLLLLLFSLGLIYGNQRNISLQQSLLTQELDNRLFQIEGQITGLPSIVNKTLRIDVQPNTIKLKSSHTKDYFEIRPQQGNLLSLNKIRLAQYRVYDQKSWQPGDYVKLTAKLKRPRGLSNQGLFDYQQWLIANQYSATGYIKTIEKLPNESVHWLQLRHKIDRIRANISQQIHQSNVNKSATQTALLVGDKSLVSQSDWDIYKSTGTIHLMVISGLHIGLIAGLGYLLFRWLFSCWLMVGQRFAKVPEVNPLRWAGIGAILFAISYTLISGISLPTVRALIMVLALVLPKILFLNTNRWWGLSLALMGVSIVDPMALLQQGFWLSFTAVFLLFSVYKKDKKNSEKHTGKTKPIKRSWPIRLLEKALWFFWSLLKMQLVLFVGLAAFLLVFQGQVNALSIAANLFAVPLMSLVIVPLEFIGLLSWACWQPLGIYLWGMAGELIQWQTQVLAQMVGCCSMPLSLPNTSLGAESWRYSGLTMALYWIWIALLFWALIKMESGYKWLLFGLLLCLGALATKGQKQPFMEIVFLDVGQGLSVLISQKNYHLLYDTGAKFSSSFDAGKDIVAPTLQQLGVSELNDVVISHPDSDHIGGFEALQSQFTINRLLYGRDNEKLSSHDNAHPCLAGMQWQKGKVKYQVLHPKSKDYVASFNGDTTHQAASQQKMSDNNRSCVILIELAGSRILLTGDIDKKVEQQLVAQNIGAVDVLLIAHHGSKHSSSQPFIRQLSPKYAIVSSGYLNRFNHPHRHVINRIKMVNSTLLNTAKHGQIIFTWATENSSMKITTSRSNSKTFWWQ